MPTHSVILLDIEGTTTSISFVADVLFPFARKAIPNWFHSQPLLDNPVLSATLSALEGLRARSFPDFPALLGGPAAVSGGHGAGHGVAQAAVDRAVEFCGVLMDKDVKEAALKDLQGTVWKSGYSSGELRGHIFEDVHRNFVRWGAQGRVCIYSSGSIAAQKLLFGHSEEGDLLGLLSAHFDTTSGGKRESASYLKIAGDLGVEPAQILFATDILEEAQAARQAGLDAVIMIRPGNKPLPENHGFPTATSFDQVDM